MWYASLMPSKLPPDAIDAAEAAVAHAQSVRAFHRRRTQKNSKQREADLKLALKRLQEVMKPIRSEIGRFTHSTQTDLAEDNRQRIRDVSLAIQRERRKIWKMRKPKGTRYAD